jgi:hypothetical protein
VTLLILFRGNSLIRGTEEMTENTVTADREFALLVGKAFLKQLESGSTETAIAFGRAFLLALGKRGPVVAEGDAGLNGRGHSESYAEA